MEKRSLNGLVESEFSNVVTDDIECDTIKVIGLTGNSLVQLNNTDE